MPSHKNIGAQINPSDAYSYVSCHRRICYDYNPPERLELVEDDCVEFIKDRGFEHES